MASAPSKRDGASPHYPANYVGHLGNAYVFTGRFKEAIAAFKAYDARWLGT